MSSRSGSFYDSVFNASTAILFKAHSWCKNGSTGSHTLTKFVELNDFSVEILAALATNYMYLIIDNETREAAVVDPVDPERVMKAVAEHNVQLKLILTTHHHWDHASGNATLARNFQNSLKVYGGDDRIVGLTHKVNQDDEIHLGSLTIRCLHTPCHTTGSICYYIESPKGKRALFSGDTLFLGSCGPFFEGDAAQMHAALIGQLSQLPDDTNVFCGHEGGEDPLKYARYIEPHNLDILERYEECKELREEKLSTMPTTIGQENLTNPFMRVKEKIVQEFTGTTDEIATLAAVRSKNYYYVLKEAVKFPFTSCIPS